jgi:hypothetical protein
MPSLDEGVQEVLASQEPQAQAQGLVPSPKTETIGRLTTAHSGQVYHPEQEKSDTSPECCKTH